MALKTKTFAVDPRAIERRARIAAAADELTVALTDLPPAVGAALRAFADAVRTDLSATTAATLGRDRTRLAEADVMVLEYVSTMLRGIAREVVVSRRGFGAAALETLRGIERDAAAEKRQGE